MSGLSAFSSTQAHKRQYFLGTILHKAGYGKQNQFALLKKMGTHQQILKGKDPEAWYQTYTNDGVNHDPSLDMLCFLLHQADISNPGKSEFVLFCCVLWCVQYEDSAIRILHLNLVCLYVIAFASRMY